MKKKKNNEYTEKNLEYLLRELCAFSCILGSSSGFARAFAQAQCPGAHAFISRYISNKTLLSLEYH